LPAEKAVIAFYARYGPLHEFIEVGDDEWQPAWTQRLEPQHQARLSAEARDGLVEPLWWVREQAQEVRLTYDLYAALKERDMGSLRALLGDLPRGKRIVGMYILAGRLMRDLIDEREFARGPNLSEQEGVTRYKPGSFSWESRPVRGGLRLPRLRPMTDDEARHWATMVLAYQLNAAEQRSYRRWVDRSQLLPQAYSCPEEPKGSAPERGMDLVRVRVFYGLTTAIYLQLGELTERDTVLRHCRGCQRLFHPSRRDQIYCDANCGDATRLREQYAERKAGQRPPAGPRRRSRRTRSDQT